MAEREAVAAVVMRLKLIEVPDSSQVARVVFEENQRSSRYFDHPVSKLEILTAFPSDMKIGHEYWIEIYDVNDDVKRSEAVPIGRDGVEAESIRQGFLTRAEQDLIW